MGALMFSEDSAICVASCSASLTMLLPWRVDGLKRMGDLGIDGWWMDEEDLLSLLGDDSLVPEVDMVIKFVAATNYLAWGEKVVWLLLATRKFLPIWTDAMSSPKLVTTMTRILYLSYVKPCVNYWTNCKFISYMIEILWASEDGPPQMMTGGEIERFLEQEGNREYHTKIRCN